MLGFWNDLALIGCDRVPRTAYRFIREKVKDASPRLLFKVQSSNNACSSRNALTRAFLEILPVTFENPSSLIRKTVRDQHREQSS